jgi:hypothetical protein
MTTTEVILFDAMTEISECARYEKKKERKKKKQGTYAM